MKIVHIERLIDKGEFSTTSEWRLIESHVLEAIKSIECLPTRVCSRFTLNLVKNVEKGMVLSR